jgi:hypothetical protein
MAAIPSKKMPAHSRLKNGMASLAYVAGISLMQAQRKENGMAGASLAMSGT